MEGSTVGEALDAVFDQHDGLRERITQDGDLRRFVNVYVSGEDIRFQDGLDTAVSDGDEVTILPAVAGGADRRAEPRGLESDRRGRGRTRRPRTGGVAERRGPRFRPRAAPPPPGRRRPAPRRGALPRVRLPGNALSYPVFPPVTGSERVRVRSHAHSAFTLRRALHRRTPRTPLARARQRVGLSRSTPGRIRTCDLFLRRGALYPAELRALDGQASRRPRCARQGPLTLGRTMDLSVVFLGTGGSVPSARRATACVLIRPGGAVILVDAGRGPSAR